MENLKKLFGLFFNIFSTIFFCWAVDSVDQLEGFSDTVQIAASSVGRAVFLTVTLFHYLKRKDMDWCGSLFGVLSLACLSRLSGLLFGVSWWLSVAIGFASLSVILLVALLIYAFH